MKDLAEEREDAIDVLSELAKRLRDRVGTAPQKEDDVRDAVALEAIADWLEEFVVELPK